MHYTDLFGRGSYSFVICYVRTDCYLWGPTPLPYFLLDFVQNCVTLGSKFGINGGGKKAKSATDFY